MSDSNLEAEIPAPEINSPIVQVLSRETRNQPNKVVGFFHNVGNGIARLFSRDQESRTPDQSTPAEVRTGITRREFIRLLGFGGASLVLTACASKSPLDIPQPIANTPLPPGTIFPPTSTPAIASASPSEQSPTANPNDQAENPATLDRLQEVHNFPDDLEEIPPEDYEKYFRMQNLNYALNLIQVVGGDVIDYSEQIERFKKNPIFEKLAYKYIKQNPEAKSSASLVTNIYLGFFLNFYEIGYFKESENSENQQKYTGLNLDQLSQKWLEIVNLNSRIVNDFYPNNVNDTDSAGYTYTGVRALMDHILLDPNIDIDSIDIEKIYDSFREVYPIIENEGFDTVNNICLHYLLNQSESLRNFLNNIIFQFDAFGSISMNKIRENSLLVDELYPLLIYEPFALMKSINMIRDRRISQFFSDEDLGHFQSTKLIIDCLRNGLDIEDVLKTANRRFDTVGKIRESLKRPDVSGTVENTGDGLNIPFNNENGDADPEFISQIETIRAIESVPEKVKAAVKFLGVELTQIIFNRYHPKDDSSRCNVFAADLMRFFGIKSISHRYDDSTGTFVFEGGRELHAQETGEVLAQKVLDANLQAQDYNDALNKLSSQDQLEIGDRNFVDITTLSYSERIELLKQGYIFYGASETHNWIVWGDDVDGEFLPILSQATDNFAAQYLTEPSYKISGNIDGYTPTRIFAISPNKKKA